MRKAIEAVLKTRAYADLSWKTVLNLARANESAGQELHPLLKKRKDIKKVGIILVASNRGLCGGFNSSIINKAEKSIKKHMNDKKENPEFILVGKKGLGINKYFGYTVAAEFPKLDIVSEVREVLPITKMVIEDYLVGKYDKIMVAYTDFVNPAKQIPRVKQILPLDINAPDEFLGNVRDNEPKEKEDYNLDYTFEPSPKEVLDEMIPRLLEVQLFQALLESNASEHSSRMTAMHQATDAASDMVNELTLSYNKARQASITSEIAEISAGANALAD